MSMSPEALDDWRGMPDPARRQRSGAERRYGPHDRLASRGGHRGATRRHPGRRPTARERGGSDRSRPAIRHRRLVGCRGVARREGSRQAAEPSSRRCAAPPAYRGIQAEHGHGGIVAVEQASRQLIFGTRDPDARGYFGAFGGRFVPETLVGAGHRARGRVLPRPPGSCSSSPSSNTCSPRSSGGRRRSTKPAD